MDKRGAWIGAAIVALLAIVGGVAWFGPFRDQGDDPRPGMSADDPAARAADAFAAAWQGGNLATVAATEDSGDVAARTLAATSSLTAAGDGRPTRVVVTGLAAVPADDPDGADGVPARRQASLQVSWHLAGDRTWTYPTTVDLVEQASEGGDDPVWQVAWTPAVVHPKLTEGATLATTRTTAERGELLALDGTPLVGLRPVVLVGIQPGATTDRASAAQQVAGIVGADAASLVERVQAAGADQVVSVITLRQEAFEPLDASLRSIPGVVLTEDEIPLAPTRDFARALLGSVGPATAEVAAASDGRVQEGDMVGLSGLQAAQDEVLGGKPGLTVSVQPADGSDSVELESWPAEGGTDLTITLDAHVQEVADEVMSSASNPAALVVIRPSTGDVLAVSNGPAGADGYNRAMVGRYPPGSTFKVASSLTLLQNGLTPDTIVPCPATIVVGKEFRNAEGEVLGDVAFREDFVHSCNTAFVGQSREITAAQLAEVAGKLGYRDLDLGVPIFGGDVPDAGDETEHAANMIGQGKVQASPFAVALASASVASGRSVAPRLIVDPDDPSPAQGEAFDEAAIASLKEMMRGVVTSGTGSALAGVPGGDVYGKTGTAEYGADDPPRTHAWFTGFQGDLAFAVVVEDGGFGGQVAAPLAAQLLTRLSS